MSEQPREETQERYIDQWPKPMFLCTHCDEQTDSDPCQECASVFDERGENYPPVLRFQVVPAPAQPEQPREGEARVDWPAKPQRGECVVGDSVWWSHDWNGNRTRCFRCGYEPALPSEQPPTRVESGTSIEEAERLAAIETDAVFGPAQPQPRGEEARVKPDDIADEPGSTHLREDEDRPPRGEGDDLAARLDSDRLQEWFTELQASASLLPEDLQIIEAMIARATSTSLPRPRERGRV